MFIAIITLLSVWKPNIIKQPAVDASFCSYQDLSHLASVCYVLVLGFGKNIDNFKGIKDFLYFSSSYLGV